MAVPFEGATNLDRMRAILDELEAAHTSLGRVAGERIEQPTALQLKEVVDHVFTDIARARDMAERLVFVEAALQATQQHYAAVFNNSYNAIIVIDGKGLVVMWNPAATMLFGYNEAEVMGQELAELIIPERYREGHRAGLQRFAISPDQSRIMARSLLVAAVNKEGAEFPLEMTIGPIRVGDLVQYCAVIRDPRRPMTAVSFDTVVGE